MLTQTRWADLRARRWDWARQAQLAFLDELPADLRRLLPEGAGDVSVVLYGHTQAGKTSLILTLLGISDPDTLERTSRVLRGTRRLGRSATALPTRYRPVLRERGWELSFGHRHWSGLDDQAMEALLSQIRLGSDAEDPLPGEIAEVGVPVLLGDEGVERALSQVLDLPGEAPMDSAEGEVVRRMADHFVPRAAVVVLVASADEPTSLRPRALLHLPVLAYWPEQTSRFRVVLTHAVSRESERRWFLDQADSLTLERWVDHVAADVVPDILQGYADDGTSESALQQSVRAVLFPVEFGDSWVGLEKSYSDAFTVARPVVAQSLQGLAAALQEAQQEGAELIAALRWPQDLALGVKREQQRRTEELELTRQRCRTAAVQLAQADQQLAAAEKDLEKVRQRLRVIESWADRAQGCKLPTSDQPRKPRNASQAIDQAADAGRTLSQVAVEMWRHRQEQLTAEPAFQDEPQLLNRLNCPAGLPSESEGIANEVIGCCRSAANRFAKRDCSAERCHRRLLQRLPKAADKVQALVRDRQSELSDELLNEVRAEHDRTVAHTARLREQHRILQWRHAQASEAENRLERTHLRLQHLEESGLRQALSIRAHLDKSWYAETQLLKAECSRAAGAVERALLQLALLAHVKNRERVEVG